MAVNTLETSQMNNRLLYLHFLCPIPEIRECSECAKCAADLYLQGAPQPELPLCAGRAAAEAAPCGASPRGEGAQPLAAPGLSFPAEAMARVSQLTVCQLTLLGRVA